MVQTLYIHTEEIMRSTCSENKHLRRHHTNEASQELSHRDSVYIFWWLLYMVINQFEMIFLITY